MSAVALSPDGARLAVVGSVGFIVTVSDGSSVRLAAPHGGGGYVLAWSTDGTTLATSMRGAPVFDGRTGALLHASVEPVTRIDGVALSADGTRLGISTEEGVRVVRAADGGSVEPYGWTSTSHVARPLAFGADGTTLFSLTEFGLDVDRPRPTGDPEHVPLDESTPLALRTIEGNELVSFATDLDTAIAVWRRHRADGSVIETRRLLGLAVDAAALGPRGELAVVVPSGVLRRWTAQGVERAPLELARREYRDAIALAEDGTLVVGYDDGTVVVYPP